MKKLIAVAGAIAAITFSGCGILDIDEDVSIDFRAVSVADTVVVGGGYQNISGRLSASEEISNVLIRVFYNDVNVTAKFDINYTSPSASKSINLRHSSIDAQIRTTDQTLQSGTHEIEIRGTIDGTTSTYRTNFQVRNPTPVDTGTPVSTQNITVAGHGNDTLGSSFNLDNGQVMLAAAAKLANSGVDLVYTYSGVVNSPVLMTPYYATNSTTVAAFQNWSSPNNTRFHKVNVNFNNIETAEEIEDLFDSSYNFEGRVEISAGDVLVVETSEGNYVLIRMETVSSTSAGLATVKSAK